jgi:hypothetical protein
MLAGCKGDLGAALRAAGNSWDSHWYEIIVSGGYAGSSVTFPKGGFYPGYPLLTAALYVPMRAIGAWIDPSYLPAPPPATPDPSPLGRDPLLIATLLLASNLSLVVALAGLWRLYQPTLGTAATLVGCGLLLSAPGSYILSSGYSESSFLAATVLAFLLAQRSHWVAAGVAGAAAAVVRLPGAFIVVPLAVVWLQTPGRRPSLSAALGALALAIGAAAFPVYCWAVVGDPLLYEHLQSRVWHHHLTNPIRSYFVICRRGWWGTLAALRIHPSPERGIPPSVQIVDALSLAWATICTAVGALRIPVAQVLWTAIVVAFPLPTAGDLFSINRYVLMAWPAFFVTGWWLRRRPLLAAAVMLVGMAGVFVLARGHVAGSIFVG